MRDRVMRPLRAAFKKLKIVGTCFALISIFGVSVPVLASGGGNSNLMKAPVNLEDKASLQKGARLYVDYCMGCHSLKYIRYERLVNDLGIPKELVEKEFIFSEASIFAQMKISTPEAYSSKWFGIQPPDLTLESRLRSPDWVYSYLLSFYEDSERPFGVNNHVFPNVGMPHVMKNMEDNVSHDEFKASMGDLTNFLAYTADPTKLKRENIGRWVLGFLAILFIPAWLLNKEYWKNIH